MLGRDSGPGALLAGKAPAPEPTNLVVEPLTAWLLPAFEELMDQGGPAGR
jgi:hypothetical protein